jgi:tRNA-dihydrouridine synthase B
MVKANLYHSSKLGDLTLPGNLFLAPLAGYTDRAFRSMAYEHGANLCFTEMVSCEAIARKNAKTLPLMTRAEGEKNLAIQIFSATVDSLERSLEGVLAFNPTLLDLNCGCPVPKVVKTGAGSALMKDPQKIGLMLEKMNTLNIPISVKIRSGWDCNSLNFIEVGKIAQQAGAKMITLHPRTRSQGYSGQSNWENLKKLKEVLDIPVFGSGDLFSAEDAKKMFETCGVDGVMFARGALGNPFIFQETKELLLNGNINSITSATLKLDTAYEHFLRSLKYEGMQKSCKEIRKHLCYYTKGLPGSSELRKSLIACTTPEEYKNQFEHYKNKLIHKNIN